ncbi:PrsW family intramembrane metalloprotease [Cellulomonas carbonis]|uniref:Membrane protein n=1 Tax=Cellulomonas carbonis T26 TaxID=947969 RepID=A0A0A0BZA0_9CELL|nr:PrsW family intramembrane metalloprotease [Cellulomonas carbonis]KGM12519.1 membrane protein [Cellulomonas carbonis T26]
MSLPGGPTTPVPSSVLAPLVPPRVRPGAGAVVVVVLLGVFGLGAVGLVGMLVGPPAFPAAVALALVPLVGVLAAVLWVDRWEPEPWQALGVAFGWGASVSVLVALVANTTAQTVLLAAGVDELRAGAWTATFVAPVVEEGIKGIGVLVLFLVWRRYVDGPVDGVVYAATVAAGFAFVENVLYFGQAVGEAAVLGDDGGVAVVFVLRAVMSPFAHVLFTAAVGLALGLSVRRGRAAWVGAFPLGLVVAMLLHGLWNGSASLGDGMGFLVLYVVVQVPLFLGTVALVVWLRHREAVVVRTRLAEYAAAGWFAPHEVQMLASLRLRRTARRWAARSGGPSGRRAMRAFQTAASRLAHQRQRAATGRDRLWVARQDEAALLVELSRLRRELVGLR